jgi:Family of unknown function (DUF6622)
VNAISNAVAHTPLWVFPLIVVVLWLGSVSLRERQVPFKLLFVLPLVLLVMSIGSATGTSVGPLTALAGWSIAAAIGSAIGWSSVRKPPVIDKASGQLIIPGSVVPLLACAVIVAWRYAFGYLYGRYPELRADEHYALVLIVGSALFGGVMIGRACHHGFCYWQATRAIRRA